VGVEGDNGRVWDSVGRDRGHDDPKLALLDVHSPHFSQLSDNDFAKLDLAGAAGIRFSGGVGRCVDLDVLEKALEESFGIEHGDFKFEMVFILKDYPFYRLEKGLGTLEKKAGVCDNGREFLHEEAGNTRPIWEHSMTVASNKVRYLVFDAESVADGDLISQIRYPGQGLSAIEAINRYRSELLEKYESEFIPYTFQIPISIAIGKLDADFVLLDIVTLDDPQYRPHCITEIFWRGWSAYGKPTLISFNGRTFDLPLLELAAFRYGISVPDWFSTQLKTWDQYRNRYNTNAHLDLQELLTNFGASRINGGLNLVANLLGKPGKMDVAGHMVQDMYHRGEVREINDYCRCDVLDTYFVFLRGAVMQGQITLEREAQLVAHARKWLEERVETYPVYATYLSQWRDWHNPWQENAAAAENKAPTDNANPTDNTVVVEAANESAVAPPSS
jgi:3'-5' exonuclease